MHHSFFSSFGINNDPGIEVKPVQKPVLRTYPELWEPQVFVLHYLKTRTHFRTDYDRQHKKTL